jgi:hypothetical protein
MKYGSPPPVKKEVKSGGSWLQGNAGHMEHMDSVKFTVLKEIDDYDE